MTGTLPPLLDSVVGGGTPRGSLCCAYGSESAVPGCASVGQVSSYCSLEQKCVNCSQPHSSDSKLCPKWKLEKEIREIKTNKNISYLEAWKLIVPQWSQTYAQAIKPPTIFTTIQTDSKITNIICPPLQYLKPLSSVNNMPTT
ncbi:uncharacterized protein TNCV_230201 [Trichonephila clavipes]|nr:uncharacterized protein TNCV_230201 [Trichonephila clavipes]